MTTAIIITALLILDGACILLCLASSIPFYRKVFWVACILLLPCAGAAVYLLMGRVDAGPGIAAMESRGTTKALTPSDLEAAPIYASAGIHTEPAPRDHQQH
jgi:hypothetical protein